MSMSLQTAPETAWWSGGLHIPLFQGTLIICLDLQLPGQSLKLKVTLCRAEVFVRTGGDPRRDAATWRHWGSGEKPPQPLECHCPRHVHNKLQGGGVWSWRWLCRGAWRITKCLFEAGTVATRELFCAWASICCSVCTTGNSRMKLFVQNGASQQMHVITSQVPGVCAQGMLPLASLSASNARLLNLLPWGTWQKGT